jgi:hypothetical protein
VSGTDRGWKGNTMGDEIGQNTQWFYNVITGEVEQEGTGKGHDHLGPYPTREAAEQAIASVREREERLSREDKAWSDGEADSE